MLPFSRCLRHQPLDVAIYALTFLGWSGEHHKAWRIRSRDYYIGPSVAIQIGGGYAIDRSFAVAERHRPIFLSGAVIDIDHAGSFDIADDNLRTAIAIQVRGDHGIGFRRRLIDLNAVAEVTLPVVQVNKAAQILVTGCDIEMAVTIEVGHRHRPRGRPRRSPGHFAHEASLPAVEIHRALALVAAGIDHIVRTVAVDIRNGDGSRAGRLRQRAAIEMELAVIHADITGHAAGRHRDIRIAITVEAPHRPVPGRPLRVAISAAHA